MNIYIYRYTFYKFINLTVWECLYIYLLVLLIPRSFSSRPRLLIVVARCTARSKFGEIALKTDLIAIAIAIAITIIIITIATNIVTTA